MKISSKETSASFTPLLSLKPDSNGDHHLTREVINKEESDTEARGLHNPQTE